jgi:hypothetical protein
MMDKQTIEVLKAAVQAIEEGMPSPAFEYQRCAGGPWVLSHQQEPSLFKRIDDGFPVRLPRKTVTVTLPECVPINSRMQVGVCLMVQAGHKHVWLYFATEAAKDEAFNTLKGLAK